MDAREVSSVEELWAAYERQRQKEERLHAKWERARDRERRAAAEASCAWDEYQSAVNRRAELFQRAINASDKGYKLAA